LLKVYDEKRFDALRSRASVRCKAARVARVSGGISGIVSTSDGVEARGPSDSRIADGKLRVGRDGGARSVVSGCDSSSLVGLRVEGDRTEDPLVMSESAEKREIGRGLPKLSRLKRSGCGGVGFGGGGGGLLEIGVGGDGPGLSTR